MSSQDWTTITIKNPEKQKIKEVTKLKKAVKTNTKK